MRVENILEKLDDGWIFQHSKLVAETNPFKNKLSLFHEKKNHIVTASKDCPNMTSKRKMLLLLL